MPLDPFLGTLALGVLGAGGQMSTNASNRRMAREQMGFQERMSSTAAQRAVRDYTLAGLNPALAYERPASSPSGASAVMGNPVEQGIATAQEARRVKKELELADATVEKTRYESKIAEKEALIRENTWMEEVKARLAESRFRQEVQPVNMRIRLLDEMMQRYSTQGLTRAALSKIVPWLSSSVESIGKSLPKGMKPGRGPEMKFEAALPSKNPSPPPPFHWEMRR